jgi:hypothetical protein
VPELSFGTHFFQDLIETRIFYLALFPEEKNTFFNSGLIKAWPNSFVKLAPEYSKYQNVIKVYEAKDKGIRLMADILTQKMLCLQS